MDPPSSAVPHEALQRQAYLLWEAAGFPSGRSDHFWLTAEQQLAPAPALESNPAAPAPARKSPKQKPPPIPPAAAIEAAPVHPTRRKPATKSAAKPDNKVSGNSIPVKKVPAKTPRKTPVPPPAKPAVPTNKPLAKSRKPKTGDSPGGSLA